MKQKLCSVRLRDKQLLFAFLLTSVLLYISELMSDESDDDKTFR